MKTPKFNYDSKDSSPTITFMKNNPVVFWEHFLNAAEFILNNPKVDSYPAVIFESKESIKNYTVEISREDIPIMLDKGLIKLEELEEYMLCKKIMDLKARL